MLRRPVGQKETLLLNHHPVLPAVLFSEICSGTKLVSRNIHQLPSLSLLPIPHPKQVARPLVPSGHLHQEASGLSSICLLPCVKKAQGPNLARATRTEGLCRPGTGWFGNSHAGLLQTGLWSNPGGGGALGSI